MNPVVIVLVLVGAVVLVLLLTSNPKPRIRENYGTITGTLAPYSKEMTECARRCNLQDPRSRLYGGTNIGCNDYCENLFMREQAKKTPPSSLKEEFVSTIEKCNMLCNVDTDRLENYSSSTIPPPFALSPDNNIYLPVDNPDYIKVNVWRNQQKRCVDECVGKYSVAEWCKTMVCPYSTMPEGKCMEGCIATKSVDNVSGGWNFDLNFRG